MKKTFWKQIGNFLLQMIPVMLGVYFGIIAGNWNEKQKNQTLKEHLLVQIEEEVKANKVQIEKVINYHRTLRDTSEYFMANTPTELFMKPVFELEKDKFYWRGTRTGTLKIASYQTAVNLGVLADMDLELVALLSAMEQTQKHYESIGNKYTQSIINKSLKEPLIDYISFVAFFGTDIVYVEEDLLRMYDEVLKVIREEDKEKSNEKEEIN